MEDRSITSEEFPYLPIRVSIRGWATEAIALLDTGFTEELIIPADVLSDDIGMPDEQTDVEVADNREVSAPVYLANLEIVGLDHVPNVLYNLATSSLLALGLLTATG